MNIFMFSQVKKIDFYKTSLFPFNWEHNKNYKNKYMIHAHFVVQNYYNL